MLLLSLASTIYKQNYIKKTLNTLKILQRFFVFVLITVSKSKSK